MGGGKAGGGGHERPNLGKIAAAAGVDFLIGESRLFTARNRQSCKGRNALLPSAIILPIFLLPQPPLPSPSPSPSLRFAWSSPPPPAAPLAASAGPDLLAKLPRRSDASAAPAGRPPPLLVRRRGRRHNLPPLLLFCLLFFLLFTLLKLFLVNHGGPAALRARSLPRCPCKVTGVPVAGAACPIPPGISPHSAGRDTRGPLLMPRQCHWAGAATLHGGRAGSCRLRLRPCVRRAEALLWAHPAG